MSVIGCKPFGMTQQGEPVTCYTLRSESGMTAEILTYGAALRMLSAPGANGFDDVVLGFDTLDGYLSNRHFFGAALGRCADRIRDAKFMLNGKTFPLQSNDGAHSLHGGFDGFSSKIWSASIVQDALVLRYRSPKGEGGYPGTVDAQLVYALTDNKLTIDAYAQCDEATVINFSNHHYFNLDGHDAGTVLDHHLKIYANYFLPTDADSIPTGELRPVDQTPFDFRTMTRIGDQIERPDAQLTHGHGYNHNFVIKPAHNPALMPVACLMSEESGRKMECWSSQPGLQLYTGNDLDGLPPGKDDAMYTMCTGVCLDAQNWPNAINQANFPSPVVHAGQTYHQKTVYSFSVVDWV